MLLNIIIIVFLLGMTGWWAKQGFFSGFLHLCLTIVAGAIALSFWEPLVLSFIIYRFPAAAWTIGLIGPFILILFVLRVAMDKLVPMNMHFVPIIDNVGGAACGLISGVLTAGLVIVGLGFLPLGPSFAGYQPLVVTADGRVQPSDSGLWLPVDTFTVGIFEKLSAGPFGTSTPLAEYRPELAMKAALVRLRYDENASIVAVPGDVELSKVYEHQAPIPELPLLVADALGEDFKRADRKVVIVDTVWENKLGRVGTYDADATARIPATQVRLVTRKRSGGRTVITEYPPVAEAKGTREGPRIFRPFDNDRVFAFSTSRDEIGWVFLVPADEEPQYIMVRNLRLSLQGNQVIWDRDTENLVAVVGSVESEAAATGAAASSPPATGTVDDRDGPRTGSVAREIVLTDALPAHISKNNAQGLQYQNDAIMSGSDTVKKGVGSLSSRTRATKIFKPGHKGMVRLELTRDKAQSLLGAARASAARLGGVWLEDTRGDRWEPTAYVVLKGNGDQEISVDAAAPIRSASQLPISSMTGNDKLYLYFLVDRGLTITSYHVGKTTQAVDLRVP